MNGIFEELVDVITILTWNCVKALRFPTCPPARYSYSRKVTPSSSPGFEPSSNTSTYGRSSKVSSAVPVLKYTLNPAALGLLAANKILRPTAWSWRVTIFVTCFAAWVPRSLSVSLESKDWWLYQSLLRIELYLWAWLLRRVQRSVVRTKCQFFFR